jgi:hypothetical protein
MKKMLLIFATIILLPVPALSAGEHVILVPTRTHSYPALKIASTSHVHTLEYPLATWPWLSQRNLTQNILNKIDHIRTTNPKEKIIVCTSDAQALFTLTLATQRKIDSIVIENPKLASDYPYYGFVGKISPKTAIFLVGKGPNDMTAMHMIGLALHKTNPINTIDNPKDLSEVLSSTNTLIIPPHACKLYEERNTQQIKKWWCYFLGSTFLTISLFYLLSKTETAQEIFNKISSRT